MEGSLLWAGAFSPVISELVLQRYHMHIHLYETRGRFCLLLEP